MWAWRLNIPAKNATLHCGTFFSKTMPACQDKATIEKLVELVRDNPVLYNVSLPEHRDALLIRNVWSSIADAMGNRCIDGDGWKKKWRNIRDTYMKKKKDNATKSGQAATRKKPWLFFNFLTFLDEFIEPSSTESNIPSPHPEFQDDEESEARLLDQSDDESASFAERASVVSFGSQSTGSGHRSGSSLSAVDLAAVRESSLPSRKTPAKKARRGDDSTIDRALQELIADHKRIQENEEHLADTKDPDGDDAFLASYAWRMRKLPAQTKSFLRVQIAQLFLNAENPDIAPLPITPLPQITQQPSALTTLYPTQGQDVSQFQAGANLAPFSEQGGTGSSIIADAMTMSQIYH